MIDLDKEDYLKIIMIMKKIQKVLILIIINLIIIVLKV